MRWVSLAVVCVALGFGIDGEAVPRRELGAGPPPAMPRREVGAGPPPAMPAPPSLTLSALTSKRPLPTQPLTLERPLTPKRPSTAARVCPPSALPYELGTTLVAMPAPLSLALVRDGSSFGGRFVLEGSHLGGATVVAIQRGRLVLRRGDHFE